MNYISDIATHLVDVCQLLSKIISFNAVLYIHTTLVTLR